MARKFFKRYMPRPEVIREHRSLQMLGTWLHDPNLFHLNRYSVSVAFFIGLVVAFIPMPMQMLLAGSVAIWWRANLPISVALVWITNPLTMPAIYFGTYKFGAWMLGERPARLAFEPTMEWFTTELANIWQPLLLGSITAGLLIGTLALLIVRLLWRLQVSLRWRARRNLRRDDPRS